MKFINLSVLAVCVVFFVQSCSNSTTPPSGSSSIQYTTGAHYSYIQDMMDTAGPSTHKDQRDSSNRDNISSTVINTNASFENKTSVVEIENVHTLGSRDTVHGYQESGNLYVWDYGAGPLLSNPALTAFTGHTVDVGWVLQSKLNASSGTTWQADSVAIPITYSGINTTVVVLDMATEQADTTVIISGKSMTAKHAHHTITATASLLGFPVTIAAVPVDTYVTVEEGLVLNVLHSFTITLPTVTPIQVEGLYTAMTSF